MKRWVASITIASFSHTGVGPMAYPFLAHTLFSITVSLDLFGAPQWTLPSSESTAFTAVKNHGVDPASMSLVNLLTINGSIASCLASRLH